MYQLVNRNTKPNRIQHKVGNWPKKNIKTKWNNYYIFLCCFSIFDYFFWCHSIDLKIYLNELKGSNRWQTFAFRIVKTSGRMSRITWSDAIYDTLWWGWPIRSCKGKTIIGASIQRIHLYGYGIDPGSTDAQLKQIPNHMEVKI